MPDLSPTGDLQEVADRHYGEDCEQWWCCNPRVVPRWLKKEKIEAERRRDGAPFSPRSLL